MNTTDPDQTGAYVPATDTSVAPEAAPPAADPGEPAGERFGNFILTGDPRDDGDYTRTAAWQVGLSRRVVVTRPAPGAPPEAAAALRAEAAVALKFAHPGVVPVVEAGEAAGTPYLVVVATDGETLAARMAKGRVPERVAAGWMAQAVETLYHAHEAGVVHGNMRPELIHLGLDGRVRLSGFGSPPPDDEEDDDFRPPMWTEAGGPGPGDDVFSVGAILWKAVTGRTSSKPSRFMSRDLKEICDRCVHRGFAYRQRRPTVPLLTDLRRFLANKPLRHQTGMGLHALTRWARRNKRLVAWAGVVLLVAAAGAAWDYFERQAAWDTLSRPDATAEEYAAAARPFATRARFRPSDPEAAAGLALAAYRRGEPDTAVMANALRGTEWVHLDMAIQRLRNPELARTNSYSQDRYWSAKDKRELSEGGTAERVVTRLNGEVAGRAEAARREALAKAIAAGDVRVMREAGGALDQPGALAALIRVVFDYSDVRDLLNQRVPDWERRPEAQEALPTLVARAAEFGRLGASDADNLLARIDPDWPKNPNTRRAIPTLAMLEVTHAGNHATLEQANRTLTLIDADWPHSFEARAVIPQAVAWLADPRHGRDPDERQPALLRLLHRIDPRWRDSVEAKEAARPLVRLLERYDPRMVAMYDPSKQAIVLPRRPNQGEETYNRRAWYDDAKRVITVLGQLGPAAAEAAGLAEWLDHPDPVYRGLLAVAVSYAVPGWAETPDGEAAITDLAALTKDPNRDTAEMAEWALNRLALAAPNPAVEKVAPIAAVLKQLTDNTEARDQSGTETTRGHNAARQFKAEWARAPLAQAALPGLIRWLAADDPEYVNYIHHRHREALLSIIEQIDPDWRTTPAARAGVAALQARLVRELEHERTHRDEGGNDRTRLAAKTLTWFGKGPLTAAVRQALATGLQTNRVGLGFVCLEELANVGPDQQMISNLLAQVVRFNPDGDERLWAWDDYRKKALAALDKIGPTWRDDPAVAVGVPYWIDLAKSDGKRGQHDAAKTAFIAAAGPGLAAAVPFFAESLTKTHFLHDYQTIAILEKIGPKAKPAAPAILLYFLEHVYESEQSAKALRMLNDFDPDWAWRPEVEPRLADMRAALARYNGLDKQAKQDWDFQESRRNDIWGMKVRIEAIEKARKDRPMPKK